MLFQEKLELAKKFNKQMAAGQKAGKIATEDLIRNDQISEEEMSELTTLYPDFKEGVLYEVGDIIKYNEKLYQVINEHTSQLDWTPDIAVSLFKIKMPGGVIPDFRQPTGAHDAYKLGDKIIFEGAIYESTIDNNAYSPTDNSEGWTLIETIDTGETTEPTEPTIAEWVQPTGAHDAYNIGDQVMFEGLVYESTIDANTYSPTDYPQGWQQVV